MKTKILVLMVTLSTFLFAGESEDFYYDRGFENGYQKGLLKGQEIAFKDAKKIIYEYKERIKAYELGKYLVQSKRLTAPQVYQEVDKQGNIKIVIIPSKIQKELNIAEIFEEFGHIPTLNMNKNKTASLEEKDLNELNSVYLSKNNQIEDILPSKVNKNATKTTLRLKKSSSTRDVLNNANVAYVENKNNFEVIFFTKQEKRDFCNQFTNFCK